MRAKPRHSSTNESGPGCDESDNIYYKQELRPVHHSSSQDQLIPLSRALVDMAVEDTHVKLEVFILWRGEDETVKYFPLF